MVCERCNKESRVVTMSYFDTATICLNCNKLEQAHPDYERARNAEYEATKSGNFNYLGIGLPADLR